MLRLAVFLLAMIVCGFSSMGNRGGSHVVVSEHSVSDSAAVMYHSLGLDGQLSEEAFAQALCGYNRINQRKRNILTVIDFSKPSTAQRMFVFNMDTRQLICRSLVAHGRNSGANYATEFSNKAGSFKSSLGFYLTATTYTGKNGYSLLLDGLEAGINDHARSRAIVVHGADYANPSVISYGGRLGRSLGCPALPQKESRHIIDTIKGGSVMFIYAAKPEYVAMSSILNESLSAI